jgi:hypothetical protein
MNQCSLNNKVLSANPLFFHGMRMITMLKCYFQRVKLSQHLAYIYKQCDELVSKRTIAISNVAQQEQFKKLFDKISAGVSIKDSHTILHEIENLIRKSRLLYTNIT